MRILLVSNTYPPADISGVGTLVQELAAELERAGHVAHVLTRRAPAADRRAVALGGSKLLWPLRAGWWYLRQPRRAPPGAAAHGGYDLVHVHESDGVCVALASRGRRDGAALVATLQVSYVEERRAVRPLLVDGRPVSRPTPAEWIFATLRAPALAALGRLTARLAHCVIAPSEQTGRELVRDYGVAPDALRVIPNGIAAGDPPAAAAREPVVLFVGRLRTRKAAAVLVEAFRRAFGAGDAEIPGAAPVRLVFLGDGEQRRALERQRAALPEPLRRRVAFEGAVGRDEIARRLASAAVFCLPSTYEGFPLAILEAMAAGAPVVASRVSGIPEAVAEEVSGVLVPPEDANALAAALRRLVADPGLATRLGEAGRRRLEAQFSIERVTAAHLGLFRRLHEQRQDRPPDTAGPVSRTMPG